MTDEKHQLESQKPSLPGGWDHLTRATRSSVFLARPLTPSPSLAPNRSPRILKRVVHKTRDGPVCPAPPTTAPLIVTLLRAVRGYGADTDQRPRESINQSRRAEPSYVTGAGDPPPDAASQSRRVTPTTSATVLIPARSLRGLQENVSLSK